jgi:hypothetical protein
MLNKNDGMCINNLRLRVEKKLTEQKCTLSNTTFSVTLLLDLMPSYTSRLYMQTDNSEALEVQAEVEFNSQKNKQVSNNTSLLVEEIFLI